MAPADRLRFCDHLKANADTTKDAQKHVAQTSHNCPQDNRADHLSETRDAKRL